MNLAQGSSDALAGPGWNPEQSPVESFTSTIDQAVRQLSLELAALRAERDGLRLELEGLRAQFELLRHQLHDRDRFQATVRELGDIVRKLNVPVSWTEAAPAAPPSAPPVEPTVPLVAAEPPAMPAPQPAHEPVQPQPAPTYFVPPAQPAQQQPYVEPAPAPWAVPPVEPQPSAPAWLAVPVEPPADPFAWAAPNPDQPDDADWSAYLGARPEPALVPEQAWALGSVAPSVSEARAEPEPEPTHFAADPAPLWTPPAPAPTPDPAPAHATDDHVPAGSGEPAPPPPMWEPEPTSSTGAYRVNDPQPMETGLWRLPDDPGATTAVASAATHGLGVGIGGGTSGKTRATAATGRARLVSIGKKIGSVLAGLLIVSVLLVAIGPKVLPYQTFFVRSGSMLPAIEVGELIFLTKVDAADLGEGDIITFERPDRPGVMVTHRIVAVEQTDSGGKVFQTKGDANGTADTWRVPAIGDGWKYAFGIPKVGYLFGYLNTPQARLAMLAIPAVVLGLLSLIDIWKPKGKQPAPRRG